MADREGIIKWIISKYGSRADDTDYNAKDYAAKNEYVERLFRDRLTVLDKEDHKITPLEEGTIIKLQLSYSGNHSLFVVGEINLESSPQSLRLTDVKTGKSYDIKAGRPFTIGRNEKNDIVLIDPSTHTSKYHAEIRFEGGKFVYEHKGKNEGVAIKPGR